MGRGDCAGVRGAGRASGPGAAETTTKAVTRRARSGAAVLRVMCAFRRDRDILLDLSTRVSVGEVGRCADYAMRSGAVAAQAS